MGKRSATCDQAMPAQGTEERMAAVSIERFCALQGIDRSTFYNWQSEDRKNGHVGKGLAPAVLKVGGRRLITLADIRAWQDRHRDEATAAEAN